MFFVLASFLVFRAIPIVSYSKEEEEKLIGLYLKEVKLLVAVALENSRVLERFLTVLPSIFLSTVVVSNGLSCMGNKEQDSVIFGVKCLLKRKFVLASYCFLL